MDTHLPLETVLLVGASPEVRAEIGRQLAEAGVGPEALRETGEADEGLSLLQQANHQGAVLVLLALEVAGVQGDEWLWRAHTHRDWLTVPVLLFGREADEDDPRIERAMTAGAQGFIAFDTISLPSLRRTLTRALACHQVTYDLAESHSHFRELAAGAPDLLWVCDASSANIFVNRVWLEYTGRTLEEELGRGWESGVHPDDLDSVIAEYRAGYHAQRPFIVEFRLRRWDGVYRWMLNRGRPRFDLNGNLAGYTGSCIDITAQKQAVEELRANEARIRSVLQIAQVGAATVDRDLRYTWVYNAQAEFRAGDLIGKRDDEVLPPEHAAPYLEFKQQALTQGVQVRRKFEVNSPGGTYRVLDMTAEPLRDDTGNVTGLTVVAVDITILEHERQHARFLVEASEMLNASLDYNVTLQQVGHAMVPKLADWCSVDLLNADGEIEQVVVAHVDPSKVEWAKELRRQNPPALDDPGGVPAVIRTGKAEFYPEITWEMILAAGPTEEQLEIHRQLQLKSLLVVPLMARGRVLGALTLVWSDSDRRYDEDDMAFAAELARRAGMAIDNAQLYAESQSRAYDLRQLSESLELRVQERTRELMRSNQDLDQFAYVASHDLKAPLRAIDHLSTWIMEDAGHMLPQRSREHLDKMRGRIHRMEGLLDDLLAYSRAGRQQGEPKWVDLGELVARAIETVNPPSRFKIEIVGDLRTIYTWHVPLETVMRNLIGNAVKHHDKQEGHIVISAIHEPEMVILTVQDDGPGIEPAYYDRIFQMFQTLRPRDQVEGSGIGLSVVKKIIESNEGKIEVAPAPERGTRFTFTWPYRLPTTAG